MDSRFIDVLKPLSTQSPCGEDLSFSPEFDRIQEARREDDPTVDYGEWQTTLKQADWKAVVDICGDLLACRSKDLRLAAWMTEGMVKTYGLRGLAEGIEANAILVERFGQQIHPQPEDGDQERRIGTLSWFVSRMAQLARQIPITAAPQYSLSDYETARHLQTQLQRNPHAEMDLEDKVTLEQFSAAVTKTDKALYVQWLADGKRCARAALELDKACELLFGTHGPSFSPLMNSIDAVCVRLQSIAREVGVLADDKPLADVGGDKVLQATLPASSVPSCVAGSITSRAQALESLRQVAAFFRQAEPHSPVAYLADKAVHWGSMPLHVWLRSVVKDRGSLTHIEELLGLDAGEDATNQ